MRVVCKANAPDALGDSRTLAAYERNHHGTEVLLQVGREYEVFGIVFRDHDGVPWFLVCEEDSDDYPKAHLAAFFEVIDAEIPAEWGYAEANNVGNVSLLPMVWAEDRSFMEKLADGDTQAIAAFAKLKAMADAQR